MQGVQMFNMLAGLSCRRQHHRVQSPSTRLTLVQQIKWCPRGHPRKRNIKEAAAKALRMFCTRIGRRCESAQRSCAMTQAILKCSGSMARRKRQMEMASICWHLQCKNVAPPECITSSPSGCNHNSNPSRCPNWKWNATRPSSHASPIAGVQWNERGNVLCNSGEPMNVVQNASRTGFRSDTRTMLDNQAVDKRLCSN